MAWWKTAKVGDKVVCMKLPVESKGDGEPLDGVQLGRVYTIKALMSNKWFNSGVGIHVGFYTNFGGRVFTAADAFRPVVNRSSETGVAALKRHLVGAPVKESVE